MLSKCPFWLTDAIRLMLDGQHCVYGSSLGVFYVI